MLEKFNMQKRLYLSMFLGLTSFHQTHAELKPTPEYQLEQVVTLMRHGIRPQTNTAALEKATGKEWFKWPVPDGTLSYRGYEGVVRQVAYPLALWKSQGLKLGNQTCPDAQQVWIYADSDQRTAMTGEAVSQGMFGQCHVPVHVSQQKKDPLFSGVDLDRFAPYFPKIQQQFLAKIGTQQEIKQRYAKPIETLKNTVCAANACQALDQDWGITLEKGKVKLTGPLSIAANIGETVRLQYSENLPQSEVAFGHVSSASDLEPYMQLHRAKYQYLNELPLYAQIGGQFLYQRILEDLTGKSQTANIPLIMYMGHDTNISQIQTILGFNWKLADGIQNDIPPASMLVFEKYQEKSTHQQYIRIYFSARNYQQWRDLTEINAAQPMQLQEFKAKSCKTTSVGTLCPMSLLEKKVPHLP